MKLKKVIAILGPTAVGKTELSIQLAQHLNCPIFSADSRQFYKEMNVGTAKPSAEELSQAEHRFINSHTIKNPLTAVGFEKEFLDKVSKSASEYIIVTGGSGLFVKAALEGIQPIPNDEVVKSKIENRLEVDGLDTLVTELKDVDEITWESIDKSNSRRVVRALEVFHTSQKPLSWWIENSKATPRPFSSQVFIITRPREELYDRINKRVDLMIDCGLEEEVKHLKQFKILPPMNTVGYQEWWPYFEGIYDKSEVIRLIQRNSRRYAKRQMTWLRQQVSGVEIENNYFNRIIELIY